MTAGFDPATASQVVELADLHHRLRQVHVDACRTGCSSRAASRPTTSATTSSISLASRRSAVRRSGTARSTGRTPRSARRTPPRSMSWGSIPDRYALGSVGVVRDGCPQREGRHPGHLGILPPHADRERRPPGLVHQRPRLPGTDPEHATRLPGPAPSRHRRLRPGCLDIESPDDELRRAIRALRPRGSGRNFRGRSLHSGPLVRGRFRCPPGTACRRGSAPCTTSSATRRPR